MALSRKGTQAAARIVPGLLAVVLGERRVHLPALEGGSLENFLGGLPGVLVPHREAEP